MRDQIGQTRPRWMSQKVALLLRLRGPCLVLLSVVTGVLCFQLKNIRMAADPLESMYPSDHPFLPALGAIKKMAPEPRMLVAILEVRDGDIYSETSLNKIDDITRELMHIDGVMPGGVVSLTNGMNHYENTAEGMVIKSILGSQWPETKGDFETLERKVVRNPMGLGRYVSYDGTAAMITATLVDIDERSEETYKQASRQLALQGRDPLPLEQYKQENKDAFLSNLLEKTRELKTREDDPRHRLLFMGSDVIRADMTAMGSRHIPIAIATMLAIVIILLAAYFRSYQGVVVPVVIMVLSVLWTLCILALSGLVFNPMALGFPVLLGIFSLAYSVGVTKRYHVMCSLKGDRDQAIVAAYEHTPVAESMLTAGLVILCLLLTGVPMMRDLGHFGLFWLLATFTAVVVLNPILLSLLPAPRRAQGGYRDNGASSIAKCLARPSAGHGRYVMTLLLVATIAAGGLCFGKLEIGDNVPGSSYIRPDHPWNRCFELMSEKFVGPFQFLIYAETKKPGGFLQPEAINALGDFSNYLKDVCGAKDSISFAMMIRLAHAMFLDGNPKWLIIPRTKEKVEQLAGMVAGQGGVQSFMDKTFTRATISPFFSRPTAERIDEITAQAQGYIDRHPSDKVEFRLAGGLLGMTKAINDGTRDAYRKTLAAGAVVLFALASLATGSLILGVAITLPLLGAQAVLWLIMVTVGMPVNMPIVPVTVAGIGFGALFGSLLIRQVPMASGEAPGDEAKARNAPKNGAGTVLFLGFLVFAATVPWMFIGLKFPSQMLLLPGIMVLLQAILSVAFVPALMNLLKPNVDGMG